MSGSRILLRSVAFYREESPRWWPARVVWDMVTWNWWRGVYWPVADTWNVIAWHYGWGAGRWPIRVGGLVRVHGGSPEVVTGRHLRAGTVTTARGTHDFAYCCDPPVVAEATEQEPSKTVTCWPGPFFHQR